MKKDGEVVLFLFIYLNSFSLIYSSGFVGIDYFLIMLILFMGYNIPSLFSVLILLAFERYTKKNISKYLYLGLSIAISSIIIYFWDNSLKNDSNFIYPIFKEQVSILISICVGSHIIAFCITELAKKIKNKYAA